MKNNEDRRNTENLDISILNRETGFLNFLRFIVFAILLTFKSYVISPACDICGDQSMERN